MARNGKKKTTRTPPCLSQTASRMTKKRPYTKRKQWTNTQMEAAMNAVRNATAESINSAAKEYEVPITTLKNRLSGRVVHGTNSGPVPYLSKIEETELVKYLSDANTVGCGKTRGQVKVIVERVALEKGVLRGACISDGWWRRFIQRHPQLSLRTGVTTGCTE